MKKKILIGAGAALLVMSVGFVTATAFSLAKDNTVIPEHVSIAGVDVSGMSKEEAANAIDEYAESLTNAQIELVADKKSITASAGALGISVDAQESIDRAMNYGCSGNLIERYQDQIDIKKGVEKNFSVVYTVDKTMTKKFIEANNDKLVQKVKENSL
ncbi:MAG: peptidoglycan binding domain-containing protein, partial [Lachnospiraceae bacterium]|nr:peptidoglycan binding domain-containing protein [Lachnospiraceae bacterium]